MGACETLLHQWTTIFELKNKHAEASTGRICQINVQVWLKNTQAPWAPSFSFFLSFFLHAQCSLLVRERESSAWFSFRPKHSILPILPTNVLWVLFWLQTTSASQNDLPKSKADPRTGIFGWRHKKSNILKKSQLLFVWLFQYRWQSAFYWNSDLPSLNGLLEVTFIIF